MLASKRIYLFCQTKHDFLNKTHFLHMCLEFVTTNFVWIKCCKWKKVLDQNLGHVLAKT